MREQKLARLKELMAQREEIDAEIDQLLGGGQPKEKRTRRCKICGEFGHDARTCPKANGQTEKPDVLESGKIKEASQ